MNYKGSLCGFSLITVLLVVSVLFPTAARSDFSFEIKGEGVEFNSTSAHMGVWASQRHEKLPCMISVSLHDITIPIYKFPKKKSLSIRFAALDGWQAAKFQLVSTHTRKAELEQWLMDHPENALIEWRKGGGVVVLGTNGTLEIKRNGMAVSGIFRGELTEYLAGAHGKRTPVSTYSLSGKFEHTLAPDRASGGEVGNLYKCR